MDRILNIQAEPIENVFPFPQFDFRRQNSYTLGMHTEVIIIGAGPIGLEAASVLKRNNMDYLQFDAGQIGHTFLKWPRNTLFYSSPEWIAIAGIPIHTPEQFRITGEQYLAYLRQVAEVLDLHVHTYERVVDISGSKGNFTVSTEKRGERAAYRCSSIILATGGLDRPRTLNLPGEDLPHVSHFFDLPHRYFRQRLLIVGGRNSAVEAAIRSWRAGANVTLSYRGHELSKEKVLDRLHLEISLLTEKQQIRFLPNTEPLRFSNRTAALRTSEGFESEIETDFVYLATGFEQDQSLLRNAGIQLMEPGNSPSYDRHSMQTNVPGIYIAGTAVGGSQREFTEFITTGHIHSARILTALTGRGSAVTGNLPGRNYPLTPEDIE